jgi:hypothetical protein
MNWKQFLTEKVLHEPEATSEYTVANNGDLVSVKTVIKDRTFTNRNDLMDLYEQIEKDGKLISFLNYLNTACDWKDFDPIRDRALEYLFKWLFCLDGSGYEEKCKTVAEFYGWNEQRDPVIDKNSGAYGDN